MFIQWKADFPGDGFSKHRLEANEPGREGKFPTSLFLFPALGKRSTRNYCFKKAVLGASVSKAKKEKQPFTGPDAAIKTPTLSTLCCILLFDKLDKVGMAGVDI